MLDHVYLSLPPRIIGGWGCRTEVAPLLATLGHKAALIVTDRYFTDHTSLVVEMREALAEKGIESLVFDEGIPDPTVEVCTQAYAAVARQGWLGRIDHVIALGGGSNIDLAKVLSLMLKHGGEPKDYVGEIHALRQPLLLVAMPTTAGSGSEITPGAILVDPASATKVAVMANDLRPRIAVVDPELTLTCPPRLTAEAGLDALTHAIESYLTQDASSFDRAGVSDPVYSGRNDITRLFAAEAIRLCFLHLPTAYAVGHDRVAREGMATASLYAALSYGNAGLNAVHALAYALAGLTHASHGSTNAVLLPYVMDALLSTRQEDLAEIARLAGTEGADPRELSHQAVLRSRELVARLGIPTTLAGFGVTTADLPVLVRNGLDVARLTKAFPIQPAGAVYERIIRHAYEGLLEASDRPH